MATKKTQPTHPSSETTSVSFPMDKFVEGLTGVNKPNSKQRKRANTQVNATKQNANNQSGKKPELEQKLKEAVKGMITEQVNERAAQVTTQVERKSNTPDRNKMLETKTPVVKFERTLTSIANDVGCTPTKAHETDACYDLVATSIEHKDNYVQYGTGIKIQIPSGMRADIRVRSSNSNKDLVLCNGVGTIDEPYRGELLLRFKVVRHLSSKPGVVGFFTRMWQSIKQTFKAPSIYKVGDKIGQILLDYRTDVKWEETGIDYDTDRGDGGFGSTDAKDASKHDGDGKELPGLYIKPIE